MLATLIGILPIGTVFSDSNPSFVDGILTIPEIDSAEKAGEFQEVILQFTDQGELVLQDYKNGVQVQVIENVELIKTESFPVQVLLRVTGYISVCLELGQISTRVLNNKFEVILYYLNNARLLTPGGFGCVAAVNFFTEIIPLPVYALAAGEYEYDVNGDFTGIFSLLEDNEL